MATQQTAVMAAGTERDEGNVARQLLLNGRSKMNTLMQSRNADPSGSPELLGEAVARRFAPAPPQEETYPVDAAEARWIRQAQEGDKEAFSWLIDLYRERIMRLALHRVGNAEDAHDLCQETFVRVYRALGSFDPKRAFTPWLYRIANNVIIDYFRMRSARPALVEPDAEQPQAFEESLDTKAVDPQQSLVSAEIRQDVRDAIMSLPESYRVVVVFRYLDDLSYAEIADALDLTEANVMMRMSRARKMLRDKLKHLQLDEAMA